LGEQEAFTGCYEVKASSTLWLDSSVFLTELKSRSTAYHSTIMTSSTLSSLSYKNFSDGVLAPNGKIYCAPSSGSRFLVIDTTNDTCLETTFGLTIPSVNSKWQCGVLAPNGKIYFIPSNAKNIIIVDPE